MSCRILGRGVEKVFLNQIVCALKDSGFEIVYGEYIKSSKNDQVKNFYIDNGFVQERTDMAITCYPAILLLNLKMLQQLAT